MTFDTPPFSRQWNIAAAMIILGLLVEAFTLYWSNPTSFLLFAGAGALLVLAGVVLYLVAIIKR